MRSVKRSGRTGPTTGCGTRCTRSGAFSPNQKLRRADRDGRVRAGPPKRRGPHRVAARHLAGRERLRHQDQPPDLRRCGAEPDQAAEIRRRRPQGTVGGPPRPLRRVQGLVRTTGPAAGSPARGSTWATLPFPFGELAWDHVSGRLAGQGRGDATEAEIAAAAEDLPGRAGQGPDPGQGESASSQQDQAAGRTRSPRSRRVRGRAAATAAPAWPRPAGAGEDSAGQAGGRAETETGTTPAQVIPLPLFDARKEAEKWW